MTYIIWDDDYIGLSEAECAGVEVLILSRNNLSCGGDDDQNGVGGDL